MKSGKISVSLFQYISYILGDKQYQQNAKDCIHNYKAYPRKKFNKCLKL